MAGKSNYLAEAVLNHIFGSPTLSKPSTVYVSLHNADPTDANVTSTEIASTGGYARASISTGGTYWNTPSSSSGTASTSNKNAVNFPTPTADWNGGSNITYAGVYDASTGGNLLYSAALSAARTVLSTDNAPQIAAGALVISEA